MPHETWENVQEKMNCGLERLIIGLSTLMAEYGNLVQDLVKVELILKLLADVSN